MTDQTPMLPIGWFLGCPVFVAHPDRGYTRPGVYLWLARWRHFHLNQEGN